MGPAGPRFYRRDAKTRPPNNHLWLEYVGNCSRPFTAAGTAANPQSSTRSTQAEAADAIAEARRRIYEDGEDPEEVLYEEFGLEPDYVFDLI